MAKITTRKWTEVSDPIIREALREMAQAQADTFPPGLRAFFKGMTSPPTGWAVDADMASELTTAGIWCRKL